MAARIVLSVTLVAVVAMVAAAPGEEKYTTKYDNVDVDDILHNDRLLNNYFNCIVGKGKCTPDGEELKKRIPEALETECQKCSEKQKSGVEKVLRFLFEKKQELFKQLEEKFDSDGKYRKRYRAEAEKKGLKV